MNLWTREEELLIRGALAGGMSILSTCLALLVMATASTAIVVVSTSRGWSPTQGAILRNCLPSSSIRVSRHTLHPAASRRSPAAILRPRMSSSDTGEEVVVFDKDVVEFWMTPSLREQLAGLGIAVGKGAETMLGAVCDVDVPTVYPLCVREAVSCFAPPSTREQHSPGICGFPKCN